MSATKKARPGQRRPAGPVLVSHRQLAARMGVAVSTLRKWAMNGTIPRAHSHAGTLLLYREADVLEYLETGKWPEGMAYNGTAST